MKQKRYSDILFVFEQEPYQITKDTDADLIVVEYDSFLGFKNLNPELEDKLYPFNFSIIRVTTPFYKEDMNIPDYEISYPTILMNSLENKFTVKRGIITPKYSGSVLTLVRIYRTNGSIVRTFSFSDNSFTFDYSNYNYDGYYVMARTMIPEYEVSSDWCPGQQIVKTPNYFCITPKFDDTIINFRTPSIERGGIVQLQQVYYSTDKNQWSELTLRNNWKTEPFNAGQNVYFKADIIPVSITTEIDQLLGVGKIICYNSHDPESEHPEEFETGFEVSGNIMSLLYSEDFDNITTLEGKNNAFQGLFYDTVNIRPSGVHGVVDASELILPETQSKGCYAQMFYGNASLEKGPVIKGNVVQESCLEMFRYCSVLRDVTLLTETIEAERCILNWLANIRQDLRKYVYCKEGMGDPLRHSGQVPSDFNIVEIKTE